MADGLDGRLLRQDLLDIEWPESEAAPAGSQRLLEGIHRALDLVAHQHDVPPLSSFEEVRPESHVSGPLAVIAQERALARRRLGGSKIFGPKGLGSDDGVSRQREV